MNRKKFIYVMFCIVILNILSTFPFLVGIMYYDYNIKSFEVLLQFIIHNNILGSTYGDRAHMMIFILPFDLSLLSIATGIAMRSLLDRRKLDLSIKFEKTILFLVLINVILVVFEFFFSRLPVV
ncbi:hypothetical protein FACS189499_08540 [Clostridia bacterium]|nr:hypothetical protein FACS189499_08540 [Clostridia bacterium]